MRSNGTTTSSLLIGTWLGTICLPFFRSLDQAKKCKAVSGLGRSGRMLFRCVR